MGDALLDALVWQIQALHPREKVLKKGLCEYEIRGRTVRLNLVPGEKGLPEVLVADGPLRQPLADYLAGSGRNETWPEVPVVQSALHGLRSEDRVSFEEVFPECRAEAMELAVMEAEARERDAKEKQEKEKHEQESKTPKAAATPEPCRVTTPPRSFVAVPASWTPPFLPVPPSFGSFPTPVRQTFPNARSPLVSRSPSRGSHHMGVAQVPLATAPVLSAPALPSTPHSRERVIAPHMWACAATPLTPTSTPPRQSRSPRQLIPNPALDVARALSSSGRWMARPSRSVSPQIVNSPPLLQRSPSSPVITQPRTPSRSPVAVQRSISTGSCHSFHQASMPTLPVAALPVAASPSRPPLQARSATPPQVRCSKPVDSLPDLSSRPSTPTVAAGGLPTAPSVAVVRDAHREATPGRATPTTPVRGRMSLASQGDEACWPVRCNTREQPPTVVASTGVIGPEGLWEVGKLSLSSWARQRNAASRKSVTASTGSELTEVQSASVVGPLCCSTASMPEPRAPGSPQELSKATSSDRIEHLRGEFHILRAEVQRLHVQLKSLKDSAARRASTSHTTEPRDQKSAESDAAPSPQEERKEPAPCKVGPMDWNLLLTRRERAASLPPSYGSESSNGSSNASTNYEELQSTIS